MINKQSSRDKPCMKLLRPIVLTMQKHNIKLKCKHISGKKNKLCDSLSQVNSSLLSRYGMNQIPITIPLHLKPHNLRLIWTTCSPTHCLLEHYRAIKVHGRVSLILWWLPMKIFVYTRFSEVVISKFVTYLWKRNFKSSSIRTIFQQQKISDLCNNFLIKQLIAQGTD